MQVRDEIDRNFTLQTRLEESKRQVEKGMDDFEVNKSARVVHTDDDDDDDDDDDCLPTAVVIAFMEFHILLVKSRVWISKALFIFKLTQIWVLIFEYPTDVFSIIGLSQTWYYTLIPG